jgi:acetyl esterase/lipase
MGFPILRCAIAAVLFLMSLMVVVPATNALLWYTVILVTELGEWFALAALILLAGEYFLGREMPALHFATMALCLLSAVLFLKPLFQAAGIAEKLPGKLSATFGAQGKPSRPDSPLSLAKLAGITSRPAAQEQALHFPTRDGSSVPLEFYSDEVAGARPCLVVIHGGGWNSGEAQQFPEWSRALAELGYRVASIGYRLAPECKWPAPREDVAAALAYLKTHASELGIDPARFVLLGRSAGGQIALDAAYTLRDPAIRACIASYAPTDMNFAYATASETGILPSRQLIRNLMGGPPESNPTLYHDSSPLDFVGPETPPTLLIQGGRDEIVWVQHAHRLQAGMAKAGRPCFSLILPWATHGFDFVFRGPGAQLELYAMAWFLRSEVG